ncbi:HPF/RaiA family ribosome-associated protein [Salinibacterium sp. PAMC 21357]|uniref:HPF/RaiA family ribosome-associated protein n=1 Tax=Salinibacterium sp. PAMC 21357 TaxID=1112215 RepID=UPI00028963AB|nr:HPF/RaiA family ribosome-associated protein [Salinibacterium sp. PAMC 21357]
MQVVVNTDNNITLNENAIREVEAEVQSKLSHFSSHLTRVEVHLSDESAGRSSGGDIQCRLEARPEGRTPELATDNASAVDAALNGALRKMQHVLDTTFGRIDRRKGSTSMGGEQTP